LIHALCIERRNLKLCFPNLLSDASNVPDILTLSPQDLGLHTLQTKQFRFWENTFALKLLLALDLFVEQFELTRSALYLSLQASDLFLTLLDTLSKDQYPRPMHGMSGSEQLTLTFEHFVEPGIVHRVA
jgi:hypothetical protein